MATSTVTDRRPLLRRPMATEGAGSWFTTIDHKKIGILYGITAFVFFLIGGIEALLIRLQLAGPDGTVLTADQYNQLFTMHGLTMVFLVVMPLAAAFMNFLIPIMIGARDVAFPRLNAFSYWTFLFGGLFLYSSVFLGGMPDGGWFAYAPLTSDPAFSPGLRLDFYALGLLILGVASTVSAINFAVTIINMRAPGMSFMRLPVFIWMSLVVSFLLIFAMPIITVALLQLYFDRNLQTLFFDPSGGGNPVLWQHLFWLFGHPEVYILILPAMGIVSEVLPTFSRKPLFGYPFVVFSGIAIGFMGWGVWAHHMFAVGLGPVANSAFALTTMFIAVPTGVKIFNWLGTLWGGAIRFTTAMWFAIGFVLLFVVGGLSGVTHAVVPANWQHTDTYYVVAHFHYVLFAGAMFGVFAGVYYWWPKVFGRMLSEGLGKLHFWLMFIGANLTFGPMHITGLQGQPRRTYTYPEGMGWDLWNLVATIGAFTIAASIVVFLVNVLWARRRDERAPADPWDGRTIEWSIPSPPPAHNFDEIPVIRSVDDFWHRKYIEDREGRVIPVPVGGANGDDDGGAGGEGGHGEGGHGEGGHGEGGHGEGGHGIHMPSPSYMPLIASFGLPVMAYGGMYRWWWLVAAGLVVTFAGLYGWALEPGTEEE